MCFYNEDTILPEFRQALPALIDGTRTPSASTFDTKKGQALDLPL